jgi:GMP synthase (glutamine-hydrolyzing) (EC 6.3.5.2)
MVDAAAFIDEATAAVAAAVGDRRAVIALSGGVDSSVAATLAYEAIGERLTPVYVDTGLMRAGETDQIRETFGYMETLEVVDARERFLDALADVDDPERKRHIIGEQFIRVFETVGARVDARVLIQGTIYPDRIESEGNIKSHHNVGGLPEAVEFDAIVEPLAELYKDEVRAVARALELPAAIADRMPFPGPGLAVRVVGPVTAERLRVAREATAIIEEELAPHAPWQGFGAVLGKATGVKGDNRIHGHVIAVRAVASRDGMTARAMELPWQTLQQIQSRITGQVDGVARVVYDITHKPPATIEYE